MSHGKRDANHNEIADTFRSLGCSVHDTADLGGGFPDLVVGVVGVNLLIEVKTPKGEHTPAQEQFYETWRGSHCTVRSREQAVKLIQSVRQRVKKGDLV